MGVFTFNDTDNGTISAILHWPLDVKIVFFLEKVVEVIHVIHNCVRMKDDVSIMKIFFIQHHCVETISIIYTEHIVQYVPTIRKQFTNYFVNDGKLER